MVNTVKLNYLIDKYWSTDEAPNILNLRYIVHLPNHYWIFLPHTCANEQLSRTSSQKLVNASRMRWHKNTDGIRKKETMWNWKRKKNWSMYKLTAVIYVAVKIHTARIMLNSLLFFSPIIDSEIETVVCQHSEVYFQFSILMLMTESLKLIMRYYVWSQITIFTFI